MFVKPVNGRVVPDPEKKGRALPESGREVSPNSYWLRRLQDGDVEKVETNTTEATASMEG